MKLLLSTLCIALLSFNNSSYALVDPDALDPNMPVVSYLVFTKNVKIASYKQGSPSHLKVILCDICLEKSYPLASDVTLELSSKPLKKLELTENLLKKNFEKVRLGIDRAKGEIIYLHLDASVDDEVSLQKNNPAGVK